ncbi:hypothetical protein PHLGIDRAFT_20816 [Phlebiopsis gigantea 11061_1 CR5-6]|uniref:RING-type domain-containing protein n=1 Tax=Phlebiopsis gigantea (strain 11061_1 CR5-6) TaxID=745531 RepID=A0A0C3S848_PHLG1|nr:hypothetical protein PHLGIDRAFT_20816 [Phlebiopsis gigantea 11061_1 CR5-6]
MRITIFDAIENQETRAVTRKCPVCDEEIPVRLLDRHAELEAERVDVIMRCIGSSEVLDSAEPDDGLTARTRKSAVKARKNMQPSSSSATLEVVDKSLKVIKRHRKQRHAKLREMTREDEDSGGLSSSRGGRSRWAGNVEGTLCPVCLKTVPGDPDVVEAHVDACLAHEARMRSEREQQERHLRHREQSWEEDVDVEEGVQLRATDGASLRGMGFAVRDEGQHDVDEDIDIDGEDEVMYGAAQFTEVDVLGTNDGTTAEDEDVEIDGDEDVATQSPGASGSAGPSSGNASLQQLVAEGKIVKKWTTDESELQEVKKTMDEVMGVGETEELNKAVDLARMSGNPAALIKALDHKVKLLETTRVASSTSLLCRICLDPYTEPTVSTGCWHTCCRECWLRCLGSTKLCPICKRITAPTDLRRVYL